MKTTVKIITPLLIALTFSMCNNANKQENSTSNSTTSGSETCMKPVSASDSAKFLSKQLEVKGEVEFPLTLTVDSLKQMNVATIDSFKVVCQTGLTMKQNISCKGVLLKDILEKARIKQTGHKDRNFYIVARATDDYKATFSWAEIFNNPTGEHTYVIFEENGMPIRHQGDMILICTNDIKTGPRHVFWLKSIEVNRVN